MEVTDKASKRLINRVGEENLEYLFDLMQADIKAHTKPHNFEALDRLKEQCKNIIDNNEPTKIYQLAINGQDIISLGFKRGKIIGEILNGCLELVLEIPEMNDKNRLVDWIERNYKIGE